MKLKIRNLDDHVVGIANRTERRWLMRVLEVKDGVLTGNGWTEPFDPVVGDKRELQKRFEDRIESEGRGVAGPIDLKKTASVVSAGYLQDVNTLLKPMVSYALHEVVNGMRQRHQQLINKEQAIPEQVIIEDAYMACMQKVLTKFPPLMDRIAEERFPEKRGWFRRLFRKRVR